MTCTTNDRALARRPFHRRCSLHASNGADHALPRALTQILRAKGRRFAEPSGEEGSWNMAGRMMAALAALWISSFAAPALAQDEHTSGADFERGEGNDDFYCGERRLGQWFYCSKPKPRLQNAPDTPPPERSAVERLAAVTRELDELKARAILDPSEENVIAYVRFQREQLDRASTFSDTWQRALWQKPELDYTLQRPVSSVGKRAWLDNRRADRDGVLANLSQRYGLFYFYAQSCGACDIFSPILRSVADSHHITVMAVSMDGGPSREFPGYVVDAGQRARMGVGGNETPALVLFDTLTKRTIPVGYGILSADEIMDRIFALTNTKVGSDY